MDIQTKLNFVTYSPCATAALSILGSCGILTTIYRTAHLGTPLTTYHRLLVAISLFDLILSIGMVVGPLPMPAELAQQGFPSARGNTATCTWQGFFLTLGMGSFGLNSMLMLHFLLVIRYNVTTDYMRQYVEPWMLAIPSLFHTSVAIAGLFLQVYNPNAPWCWTGTYPRGCQDMPDVECTRGEQYEHMAATYFIMVPLTIWTALLVICLLLVAVTVLQRFYASRQFALSTTTHRSTSNSSTMAQARRAQQVVFQCFLYSFTFLNTTIWMSMNMYFDLAGVALDMLGKDFWMLALALFFLPMQGFFSFLIFIRVRYLSNRAHLEYQRKSRWIAFWDAVWNPNPRAVTISALGRRRSSQMVSPGERQPNTSSASSSVLQAWWLLRRSSQNIVPNNSLITGPGTAEEHAASSISAPFGEPDGTFPDSEHNIKNHENHLAHLKDNDGAPVSGANLAPKNDSNNSNDNGNVHGNGDANPMNVEPDEMGEEMRTG